MKEIIRRLCSSDHGKREVGKWKRSYENVCLVNFSRLKINVFNAITGVSQQKDYQMFMKYIHIIV